MALLCFSRLTIVPVRLETMVLQACLLTLHGSYGPKPKASSSAPSLSHLHTYSSPMAATSNMVSFSVVASTIYVNVIVIDGSDSGLTFKYSITYFTVCYCVFSTLSGKPLVACVR
jgi:hypothetical protein